MNLIASYASDSDDDAKTNKKPQMALSTIPKIDLAPDVDVSRLEQEEERRKILKMSQLVTGKPDAKNHLNGKLEEWNMNDFAFDEQYHSFMKYGVADDPNSNLNRRILVTKNAENPDKVDIQYTHPNNLELLPKSVFGPLSKEEKGWKDARVKKRKKFGDAATGNFLGPWAKYEEEEKLNALDTEELRDERQNILNELDKKRVQKQEERKAAEEFESKTVFYGDSLFDYKGRSYILPPLDLKPHDHVCFIPKTHRYTYSGHTKEVQVIRFFPKYGHYLLSGGFDSKINLWDVYHNKKLVRSYMGHREAVRDLSFTNDGLHFLSASYDKTINYWDTETGKVVKTFNIKKFPYCVRFHPDDAKQYAFLCASQNKKIAQFDVRTGNRTQQYDEHLGAVNTVTFIDSGRKFVSTSDDKKIFLWEFGIPVVVKHISEPEMHSITSTAMHPNGKYFAGQSSDNKIAIYDAKNGNFKLNRKKKFQGHLCAGHSIGLTFSPDGQFLASGDIDGKVWVWDWKSTRNLRSFEAHSKVTAAVEWHPIEPSRFASAGWDHTIKMWD